MKSRASSPPRRSPFGRNPVKKVALVRGANPKDHAMKLFSCQGCGQLLYFENVRCENCQRLLGYLPDLTEISALDPKPEGGWVTFGGTSAIFLDISLRRCGVKCVR